MKIGSRYLIEVVASAIRPPFSRVSVRVSSSAGRCSPKNWVEFPEIDARIPPRIRRVSRRSRSRPSKTGKFAPSGCLRLSKPYFRFCDDVVRERVAILTRIRIKSDSLEKRDTFLPPPLRSVCRSVKYFPACMNVCFWRNTNIA